MAGLHFYHKGAFPTHILMEVRHEADLLAYTEEFGAFLSSANPNLTKEAVADLVKEHILTLKAVIDAQAEGNPDQAYMALRKAYAHMQMIADPLAEAIVKQFPDKFRP